MEKDFFDYAKKYKNFNEAFSHFQLKSRTEPNYYAFQAYKDLKLIIFLYADIYDFQGFKSLELSPVKLEKLLEGFSCFERQELIAFFIKKLSDHGHDQAQSKFLPMLDKEEIRCSWVLVKNRKRTFQNLGKLLLKLSSYNLLSLILSLIIFFLLSSVILIPAPLKEMEVLAIEKVAISSNDFYNHIFNILLYFFDVDGHMSITPLNPAGAFLLVLMKIILILVVGNFIVKKILEKIKFQ